MLKSSGRRIALLVLTALLPATGATTGASAEPEPAAGVSCSWSLKTNAETLNVAFPDTSSTYWTTPYLIGEGQKIVVHGAFPFARFMSLTTYDSGGSDLSGAIDEDIVPKLGSTNPYADASASDKISKRKYRVVVEVTDATDGNTLQALPTGQTEGAGFLTYRIYLPDPPYNHKAGVALPSLTFVDADGTKTKLPECTSSSSTLVGAAPLDQAPAPFGGLPADPDFLLPTSTSHLFPNPANKYLYALAPWVSGSVVVVRGKAPTFPDTGAGQSVTVHRQMRYWSMCQNLNVDPDPVVACSPDEDTPVDGDRYYTYVISAPEDRPANAHRADGVTWLEWGDTSEEGVIILRNMLPDPDFRHSIQMIGPTDDPDTVMGSFAPYATYCTTAQFEAWAAACDPLP